MLFTRFIPSIATLVLCVCFGSPVLAAFPNTTQPHGELLSHNAPEMGRLAIIETLGDYVITIPEKPSSPAGSDFIVRAWDISDPANPRVVGEFGDTKHPFNAHGTIKWRNQVYIGGYPNNAIQLEEDGSLSHARWSGPSGHYNKSGLMRPWSASMWWSYGDISGDAWLALDGERTAEWDHLGLTGVIGFPVFMGNIMIYASDQSMTGVASYDVSDPTSPRLLDVLTLPQEHPTLSASNGNPLPYGLGGYWNEVSHNYVVFARRGDNPGVQVVDFSDPSNLRLQCEFLAKDPKNEKFLNPDHMALGPYNFQDYGDPMYVGFQDKYVFAERYKVNIETCEVDVVLDESGAYVDTSQYARPVGNLVLTGGLGRNWRWPQQDKNASGLGIWAHQGAPDTNPPYVAYHIPKKNQSYYPVMAPISVMIPETLRSTTIVPNETIILTEVDTGEMVEIDYILSHTGMLTIDPVEYLKPDTVYEMALMGIEDAVRNVMSPYSFRFSTGAMPSDDDPVFANQPPEIDGVQVTPEGSVEEGNTVQFIVTASDADDDPLQYRYSVRGVTEYSEWTSSNSFSHLFSEQGNYTINVQVRDGQGGEAAYIARVHVAAPGLPGRRAVTGAQMAYDQATQSLWVVNPDNSTLTQVDAVSGTAAFEVSTLKDPRGVTLDDRERVWVSAHDADAVQVFDASGNSVSTIELGYGAAPMDIVADLDAGKMYVSLYGSGELVRLDINSMKEDARLPLGPTVKALALSEEHDLLLATRFVSTEHEAHVWQVDLKTFSLTRTFRLLRHMDDDTLENGRGVLNYLAGVTLNRAGTRAYVVGKKDNVDRGFINANEDLDDDNTVRTFATILDLQSGQELRQSRFDFDNADSPSGVSLSDDEQFLFVAMQGLNQVFALNVAADASRFLALTGQFLVESSPQSLAFDSQSKTLFVKNFLSRSVSMVDLEQFLTGGSINPPVNTVVTVANEIMSEQVLKGKQLFYHAAEGVQSEESPIGRISAEGYISCVTCHFDGGHDGRTYDFTGRGEGMRNNISLHGRGGPRFGDMHWSANFDEVQDFENDIRHAFNGRGLMTDADFNATSDPLGARKAGLSEDLDALAAYVESLNKDSLPRSPYRQSNGEMTAEARAGQVVFEQLNCGSCHRGSAFTDGDVHDVGTVRAYSGDTRNEPLALIKTPTLLSVFDSPPYLHDGSAPTLADVFLVSGGTVLQAEALERTSDAELVEAEGFSYLREGAGVRLPPKAEVVVDHHTVAGKGVVRVRAGGNDQPVTLSLNDSYTIQVPAHQSVDGEAVAYSEFTVAVNYDNGPNIWSLRNDGNHAVIVDDVTLGTPDVYAKSHVHTQVLERSATQQGQLVAFLQQIDWSMAPEDHETVVLGAIPVDDPPPVNDPPVTNPPVTNPPVTNPPVTNPPDDKPEEKQPPAEPPRDDDPVVKEPVDKEPVEPDPVEQEPVDKEPVEPDPVVKEPVDKEPVEPDPVVKEPVDKEPVEPDPVEPDPVDKDPVEQDPVEQEPVDKEPVEQEPVDKDPVEQDPVDKEPVEPDPVEPDPVEQGPGKEEPVQPQPDNNQQPVPQPKDPQEDRVGGQEPSPPTRLSSMGSSDGGGGSSNPALLLMLLLLLGYKVKRKASA